MPTVVEVRKKQSRDGKHKHITKVKTRKGAIKTRKQVFDSIESGKKWWSQGRDGGRRAEIIAVRECPECASTKKRIRTVGDSSRQNNLDELPEF